MRTKTSTALGLLAGIALGGAVAHAAWPVGSIRTIPGNTCVFTLRIDQNDAQTITCPFINDSDTYAAILNETIWADYHVASSNGGTTYVEPCRQSYTGGSAECTPGSSYVSGNGPHDVRSSGFADLDGDSKYDYYYTNLITTESIDVVYGIGYEGS